MLSALTPDMVRVQRANSIDFPRERCQINNAINSRVNPKSESNTYTFRKACDM